MDDFKKMPDLPLRHRDRLLSRMRGGWLDRGELDKIIERSVAQPSPPREREAYHDRLRSHDKGDYRYKKKKSLLRELFDF